MDLSSFPRLNLVPSPTPLEELPRFANAIGSRPRIFIKRDDATTVGLGGNKVRKLDFAMAEAVQGEADVIITTAGVQSNHCRQTLAIARRLGMDCHLVLTGDEPPIRQGNLLIFSIMGAHLHFIGSKDSPKDAMESIAAKLRQRGCRPHIIPIGASTPVGALGYVESTREAVIQAEALSVGFQHAFITCGSAGTQAGVEVGVRTFDRPMKVSGISVLYDAETQKSAVSDIANGTFELLGMDQQISPGDITVYDQYYGGVYGVPTTAGNDAIRLLARTEGIVTDPVYTGKALSGMIDLLQSGAYDDAEAVLFFHTGGVPAIFAMAEHFQE